MLHDPADVCKKPLNFNLSASLTKPDLVNASNSQLNLLDSSLDTKSKTDNKCLNSSAQQPLKSDLLPSSSSSLLASNSAEKLSWKFFEQVDTLDNQLRSDVSSPPTLLNGGGSNSSAGLFLTSPSTIGQSVSSTIDTNDVNLFAVAKKSLNALEGMHSHLQTHQQNQQTQLQQHIPALAQGCNRKSNGYAINGTIQTTEILSQTNAPTKPTHSATTNTSTAADTTATLTDLNFLPQLRLTLQPQPQEYHQKQQQEQTTSTFEFTSPTSTFKRKKQQKLLREAQEAEQQKKQQQHQQQQQQYSNNNLYKIGSNSQERPIDSTSESAITSNDDYSTQKHIQNNSNNNNNNNDKGSNLTPKRLLSQSLQQQQQQQQQRNNSNSNSNSHTILTANDTKTVINNSLVVPQPDNTVTYATSSLNSLSCINGSGTLNRNSKGNGNGNGTTRLTFKTHTLPAIGKTSTNSTFTTNDRQGLVANKTVTLSSTVRATKSKSPAYDNGCADKLTTTTPASSAIGKRRKKMQASSSGGSGTTTTAKGNSTSSLMDDIEMHLGLIGWRKKCLYTLLVLLMLLIIINLGLTLWILKVMEFSTHGMGQLKIVPGGIQLTGQAIIMDMLRASTIRSRHGQPISIESSRNFSINTRDANGMLENHLFLGHDKLECLATTFRINDTNGRNLFSVNRNEVTIGAHALRIDGEGGAIFRESIQTPHVRAEPGHELRLESPTRQLEMTAAKDINFQSRAGGIDISALEDVKLAALDGSIRLESSKIFMPNLRTVQLPLPGTPQSREHLHRVFQLCACSNGKLFLAAPHSICAGDDTTVCR